MGYSFLQDGKLKTASGEHPTNGTSEEHDVKKPDIGSDFGLRTDQVGYCIDEAKLVHSVLSCMGVAKK